MTAPQCEHEHVCPTCDGDGRYEVVDFRRLTSASEEPPLMWRSCETCGGTGVVSVDSVAEEVICAIRERHRHARQADLITIEAQRAHIASLEARLRAERDRCAEMARFVQEGVRS